jgi:hypothetical protein
MDLLPVHDVDGHYFTCAARIKCKGCAKRRQQLKDQNVPENDERWSQTQPSGVFSCNDIRVLGDICEHHADVWKASVDHHHCTQKCRVTKVLNRLLSSNMINANQLEERLLEWRSEDVDETQLANLHYALRKRLFGPSADDEEDEEEFDAGQPVAAAFDPVDALLKPPAAQTIRNHLQDNAEERQEFRDRCKGQHSMSIHLKLDVTKKLFAKMTIGESGNLLAEFLTIMNEKGYPVIAINVQTDSYDRPETKAAIRDFLEGLREQGYDGPSILTVDNKLQVEAKLLELFPSVRERSQRIIDGIDANEAEADIDDEASLFTGGGGGGGGSGGSGGGGSSVSNGKQVAAPTVGDAPQLNTRGCGHFCSPLKTSNNVTTEPPENDEELQQFRQDVNDNRRKRQRSEKQDGRFKNQPGSAYCIALRQLDSFVNDHSRVGELHLSAMSTPQRAAVMDILDLSAYKARVRKQQTGYGTNRTIVVQKLPLQSTRHPEPLYAAAQVAGRRQDSISELFEFATDLIKKKHKYWPAEGVHEDAWHFNDHLNRLCRSRSTRMFKQYNTMMSQAIFKFVESYVPEADYKGPTIASRDAVVEHLASLYKNEQSDDQFQDFLDNVPHKYWATNVRRVCPSPEVMARHVIAVYEAFIGVRDPETACDELPDGALFFKSGHEESFKQQLKYVCSGSLSDPLDISFYTTVGQHATGLEIFKCTRNSSDLEGYHTDLQFYTRPPKGKHAGPGLLNAAVQLHLWRVFVKAARKHGDIDPSMHHFNVCLRDDIYELCRILRIDQANVNYVRTKKAGDPHYNHTYARTGIYYGMQAETQLLNRDELEELHQQRQPGGGMAVPREAAPAPHSVLAIAAQHVRGNLAGPGGPDGPAAAGQQRRKSVGSGRTTADFVINTAGPLFQAEVRKWSTMYGWHTLQFVPTANVIRALLDDQQCVDNPDVLHRCAFMYYGVFLTQSVAFNLVSSCEMRELVHLRLVQTGRLNHVMRMICIDAEPTHTQMRGPNVTPVAAAAGAPAALGPGGGGGGGGGGGKKKDGGGGGRGKKRVASNGAAGVRKAGGCGGGGGGGGGGGVSDSDEEEDHAANTLTNRLGLTSEQQAARLRAQKQAWAKKNRGPPKQKMVRSAADIAAAAEKKRQQGIMRNRLFRERQKMIDLTVQTEAAANILMLSEPTPHPPAAAPEPAPEPSDSSDDDIVLPFAS